MKIGELELSEALQVYNAYRAKIVAEDSLINQRISWMLWSEAILFAIWAALALPDRVAKLGPMVISISLVVVSLFEIIVAYISKISIDAARDEIDEVKAAYKTAFKALYDSDHFIPRLHSGKKNFSNGLQFGFVMPWIFIFLHASAILYAVAAYTAR